MSKVAIVWDKPGINPEAFHRFSPPAPFQSGQCPRAATEFVGFDAESLEHADVEIAKWRWVFGIER